MKALLTYGLVILSVSAATATAQELNNCDGVITNRPCGASVTPHPVTISTDAQIRSKKSLLLHDLTMKSIRAKREHEVDVDISHAQEVCNEPSSTIEKCRETVQPLDDRIEDRVTANKMLEATRRKEEQEAKKTPIASDSNQVVIINNVPYRDRRRGGYHHSGHDHHDHGRDRPDFGRPRNDDRGPSGGPVYRLPEHGPRIPPGSSEPPPPVPKPQRMRLP